MLIFLILTIIINFSLLPLILLGLLLLKQKNRALLSKEQQVEKLTAEIQEKTILLATKERDESNFREKMAARENDIKQISENFENKFKLLANQIFDEKTAKFKAENKENLGQLLNPLQSKLSEFKTTINQAFGQQAKEQFALKSEITRIVEANQKITLQAENLTKALKGDNKLQGNWGEIMLEKILADSGLRRDHDYQLQGQNMALTKADGSQQRPDIIVKLPEAKHIIIDAKVSLVHYEAYRTSQDEPGRALSFIMHK